MNYDRVMDKHDYDLNLIQKIINSAIEFAVTNDLLKNYECKKLLEGKWNNQTKTLYLD